ncbi:MAG: TIGR03862 family flavoprotein, partial [Candidatus Eremiobacterota bacterium]
MTRSAAVVGGGPAGLMAAEALSGRGIPVDVYDAMPSPGRKFLLAGKGGLNLTHSEPREAFLARYGPGRPRLQPFLDAFGPLELRDWAAGLGVETFVGSSRRVFPREMKAAPLLRAWLRRLRESGVRLHVRHRWTGWDAGEKLRFEGRESVSADAVVLALGGASWPRLGSDAAWVPLLGARGVRVEPLRPANCGFEVPWSEHFRERFAGHPVKSVKAGGLRGEFVVTAAGVEGSLLYALSAGLRDEICRIGRATLAVDLAPDRTLERLVAELSRDRGSRSMAEHLRRRVGLSGVKAGLLRELAPGAFAHAERLAAAIKALPFP